MTVIVLPGKSLRNQELLAQAKRKHPDAITVRWSHWDGPEDTQEDYQRVKQLLKDHPQATVYAKSFGGVLVMKAIDEGLIQEQDITILGALPQAVTRHGLDTERIDKHVRIIQNEHDPYASHQEVKKHFRDVTCIKGNDTHTYTLP